MPEQQSWVDRLILEVHSWVLSLALFPRTWVAMVSCPRAVLRDAASAQSTTSGAAYAHPIVFAMVNALLAVLVGHAASGSGICHALSYPCVPKAVIFVGIPLLLGNALLLGLSVLLFRFRTAAQVGSALSVVCYATVLYPPITALQSLAASNALDMNRVWQAYVSANPALLFHFGPRVWAIVCLLGLSALLWCILVAVGMQHAAPDPPLRMPLLRVLIALFVIGVLHVVEFAGRESPRLHLAWEVMTALGSIEKPLFSDLTDYEFAERTAQYVADTESVPLPERSFAQQLALVFLAAHYEASQEAMAIFNGDRRAFTASGLTRHLLRVRSDRTAFVAAVQEWCEATPAGDPNSATSSPRARAKRDLGRLRSLWSQGGSAAGASRYGVCSISFGSLVSGTYFCVFPQLLGGLPESKGIITVGVERPGRPTFEIILPAPADLDAPFM